MLSRGEKNAGGDREWGRIGTEARGAAACGMRDARRGGGKADFLFGASPVSALHCHHWWASNFQAPFALSIPPQPPLCDARAVIWHFNMDPISLTIGIIPLIGGSIKLYKASHSGFRVFRHYSREVDRVRKQFERQRQFFLNEVHLTLRLILSDDEPLIRAMVEDGEHPNWQSRPLDDAMLECFRARNCRVLNEIIQDIGETITAIQEELQCFTSLEAAQCTVRTVRQKSVTGLQLTNAVPAALRTGLWMIP